MKGSSLPLHPSLASALSRHGVSTNAFSSSIPSASAQRRSIEALTIHPSLPRVAYLAEETTSLSSPKKNQPPPTDRLPTYSSYVKTQRIIVQAFDPHGCATLNEDDILACLPMEQLAPQLNRFRSSKFTKAANTPPLTLASMGPLRSIDFLDSQALHWQTHRSYSCFLDHPAKQEGLGGEFCLSLQFTNVVAMVRLSSGPTTHPFFTVIACLEGGSTSNNHRHTPSSAVLPLTTSILVYGCSDGAMRFHNLIPSLLYSSRIENRDALSLSPSLRSSKQQATIKSVRGPNGRNDPIVKIVNVDPAYSYDRVEGSHSRTLQSRLLTVCASGVAYLWDVHVRWHLSSGTVQELTVDPPLVRMDGLGRLTVSPRKVPPTSEFQTDRFWSGTKKGEEASAPYSPTIPAIHYDYNRDLLLWTLPSNAPAASIDHRGDFKLELAEPNSAEAKKEEDDKVYLDKWAGNGENGGFVKVWNMSVVRTLLSKSKEDEKSVGPQPPPKFAPAAVFQLHPSCASAAVPSKMMGGLMIGPLSPTSISYTCLSQNGSELIVQMAPLPAMTSNTDESWLVQSSISSAPKKQFSEEDNVKILYANFVTCCRLPISSMGITSITASFSSPDSLVMASNEGVRVGILAKGASWYSDCQSHPFLSSGNVPKSLSFDTTAGNVHTIISGGPVSSLNNRVGVLFVENKSVFASRLTTPRSSNDTTNLQVEKIGLQKPMLMHLLQSQSKPWEQLRSTRISMFAEVSEPTLPQPKLIPSPSGRYLCLFWENDMRYEVLHAASLLTKETTSLAAISSPLSPSVDSGSQMLSFAWVGDDDHFAILRYVDLNASKTPLQSSPSRGEMASLPPPLDTRRKIFSRLLSPADEYDQPASIRPHVELKKLVEAQIDAVEVAAGASVAAATTVDLGRLSIRGGDRSVPTTLFGGPVLCVGCVSIPNRSNHSCIDNSMAYFYTRKSGAVNADDEKASAYVTVGPEIPYPSLIVWDEDGKLCAMALGSRVAIYISEAPNFTLLGAVNVHSPDGAKTGVAVLSLKFIHGVLYCSTPSSVHAIFLGNLNDQDTVCEMDVFTIATNNVSMGGTGNDSCPVPAVTSLIQPHILGYHCGGLLISTLCGLRLLPMSHPILRIGTLLGANLVEKARKWIYAIPNSNHDMISHFLIRRGRPDLAISDLDGLSLERYINLCMMYDHIDELEYLVEKEGQDLICQISDWNRGSLNGSYSAIFRIGIYFLGNGRMEIVKKWVELAMNSGVNEVVIDAMKLSLYISAADRAEGQKILRRVSSVMKLNSSAQMAFLGTA